MAARTFLIGLLVVVISGCVIQSTPDVLKIALLAPFEGQYREIGYEALYAARLAIDDDNSQTLHLLAIDDGGSVDTAILRAQAIQRDPAIDGVLLIGLHAVAEPVQRALPDIPAVIIGHWNTMPVTTDTMILAHPDIDAQITFAGDITDAQTHSDTLIGSELLSLAQVPQLLNSSQISVISSSSLPDPTFRARYLNSAEFVPEPRLIAPLTYDATRIILATIRTGQPVSTIEYAGLTGMFRFDNGYWADAPINRFIYENSELVQSPD